MNALIEAGASAESEMRDKAWVRHFFRLVDSQDVPTVSTYFHPEIVLQFGNQPQAVGVSAVRAAFESSRGIYKKVRHDILSVSTGSDAEEKVLAVECRVTYTLKNDKEVSVPCTSVLQLRNLLIRAYRIYIDLTPVIEALTKDLECDAIAKRKNNIQSIERFLMLLGEKRMDQWLSLWDEDGRQIMPYSPDGFPKLVAGKEAVRKHYSGLPTAYGRMEFFDLTTYPTTDPDIVVAVFRGEIEVLATGRRYDNNYCCIFKFKQGRISEYVEYYDPNVLTKALDGSMASTFNLNKE